MEKDFNKITVFLKSLILIFLGTTFLLSPCRAQNFSIKKDSLRIKEAHHLPLRPLVVDSNFFSREIKNIFLQVELKPDLTLKKYYDIRNVLPKNPMMLDTREGSYYTPKIVQDRLTFFMNRPRADSFVPIPTVAFLAASVAMHYLQIEKNILITAEDYLVNDRHRAILFSLWQKSPQTISDIYSQKPHQIYNTYETLSAAIDSLIDKRLIKRRNVEKGETLLYPAQPLADVITLLDDFLLNGAPEQLTRQKISKLCTNLKNIQ